MAAGESSSVDQASYRVLRWFSRRRNLRRVAVGVASVVAVLFPDLALPTVLISFAFVNMLD